MVLWHEAELSPPLPEPLRSKKFRHKTAFVGADGKRTFLTTAVVGITGTVDLLDALAEAPDDELSGELRYYRHLLTGVRAFVASGAVAPAVVAVADEPLLRWQIVPTPVWRGWFAALNHASPPALDANGGTEAIADLAAEFVDYECRQRCRDIAAESIATPALRALLPDAVDELPFSPGKGASAWAAWSGSVAAGESTLLLRLYEPHSPADDLTFDDPAFEPVDTPERWRLAVCRRLVDGAVEAVVPHRLEPTELDSLTTDLAGAVKAWPQLTDADHDPHNLDFLLPTTLTEEFLATGATALAESGIQVLLPRTIATVRPTLSIRALPVGLSSAVNTMVGLDDVRNFEWRLALGDSPDATLLSQSDLDELAHQQGSLVRIRGRWVTAEDAALTRAAQFIAAQRIQSASDHPADVGELFGLVTGDTLPVPVSSVQGLSWLDDAITGSLIPQDLSAPDMLTATLRPYQQRGFEWLAYLAQHGIGGVLADDMGLGKTIQVIALTCHDLASAAGEAPTADSATEASLVVCPMSLVGNWEREFARFAPTVRTVVHHGSQRSSGDDFAKAVAHADVVITTFALVARDSDLLTRFHWRRVIVDEAQHVKNVATRQAKALRLLPTGHRIALTGTPVENRLEDLRAVVDLVNPGLLGSPSVFRARFADPIERERDSGALRRLTAITRPFILRREKTDPAIEADLPAKTELTVRTNLTVEQAALYRAVIDDLMEALSDPLQLALRRRTVLAALTRLKQVCNHPAHYLADGSKMLRRNAHRSGKVELLTDILTTVTAEGDRTLVFTQFAAFAHLLAPWLTEQLGVEIPVLHGGMPRPARDQLVADFQSGDGPPALLATLKAGGTGLNLTAANQVVHVDRWWNPAVEQQATDRAYRIGQQRAVQVRKFVCVGTLEERIDEMITAKKELAGLTVNAGEHWLGDVGDEELFELFRLRDEAVSE
ncbi:putative helicase [Gordonia effusa NBRC 100432]|uniref:Putative helicase n=1 Tax=Gordonia effusa NBRC 100432 TaxID=1077974 RepID=H0R6Y6_9ACTN|nr:DEAD/DEAH box helicase [Gordonia effusa]GAB20837.1 putative helicase [Gordonia effusa NBRC 100432]